MKAEKQIKEMAKDKLAPLQAEWTNPAHHAEGKQFIAYREEDVIKLLISGYTEAQKDMEPKGKYLTVSEMRDMEKQVLNGEISYSKMLELINERIGWKPGEWHELKRKEVGNG